MKMIQKDCRIITPKIPLPSIKPKKNICIHSGWATDWVVDDEFKDSTWEINNTGHTKKLITTRIR